MCPGVMWVVWFRGTGLGVGGGVGGVACEVL